MELLQEKEDKVGVQQFYEARERMSYLLAQESEFVEGWRYKFKILSCLDEEVVES
jgi:hypothetical protein